MNNTEMVSVPREHELKIRQTPLADLLSGLKTGEIRDCSDREFAVGDTVLLREIDEARDYTGTIARRTITHVQKHYGLPDHLCVLSYGHPAEQHQGEPVAYQIRSMTDRPGSQWTPWRECCDTTHAMHSHEVGRFNRFGIMREIRPVFASAADPGEVERLRTERRRMDGALVACANERDSLREENERRAAACAETVEEMSVCEAENERLRAKLAERTKQLDNALDDLEGLIGTVRYYDKNHQLHNEEGTLRRYRAALSTSAEPSAP